MILSTKKLILEEAIKLAKKVGYDKITSPAISKKTGKSVNIIFYHYKSLEKLKREVIKESIEREIEIIVAQKVGEGKIKLSELTPSLSKKILKYIS